MTGRPNETLRSRYAAAAAKIRASGAKVTTRALAAQLKIKSAAVKKFLERNPAFAEDIGLCNRECRHAEDYVRAIENVYAKGEDCTHANIARELGRDRMTVTDFLGEHPEVQEYLEEVRRRPRPLKQWPREITAFYYDEQVQRIVMNKISLTMYIRLWQEKKLKFQIENTSKPEHLPSLEEAQFSERA